MELPDIKCLKRQKSLNIWEQSRPGMMLDAQIGR